MLLSYTWLKISRRKDD